MDQKNRWFERPGTAFRWHNLWAAVGVALLTLVVLTPIALAQSKFGEERKRTAILAPNGNLFRQAMKLVQGTYISAVAIGDLNNDGRNDVAAGASGEIDEMYVFLQNASGMLGTPIKYPTTIEAGVVKTGDLNNDGLDDVAIAGYGEGKVGVFLQLPDGTLAGEVNYATLTTPDALAIGDLNHDGLDDLAVTHASVPVVGVLYQQNNGILGQMRTKPTEYSRDGDLEIGDMNGDGLLDLVRLNRGRAGDLYIFMQTPAGQLADHVIKQVVSNNGAGGLALGDVNGDQRTDILTGSHLNGKLFVILQQAGGVLAEPIYFPGMDDVTSADLADVNNDGWLDFVAQTRTSDLGVHLQANAAKFKPVETYSTSQGYSPHGMAVGDVNNDGWTDVVTANDGVFVHYNFGPGGTPTPTPTPTNTPKPKPPKVTIMQQDFESGFPGGKWQVLDGWGRARCQVTSGVYSAWAVSDPLRDKCTTDYPNNSYNWMIYGPFNLEDATKATLKYNLWLNAEPYKDIFFVGASINGTNFYGRAYTGVSGQGQANNVHLNRGNVERSPLEFETFPEKGDDVTDARWARMTFKLNKVPTLGNVSGQKKVWLAFVWQTDAQKGLRGGVFVDDVLLTKVKRQ